VNRRARIYPSGVDVIVSHANTDFDALAAMLAARRLYPGAVIALTGSLNRNVREFYRLHADELEMVDSGRVDLDEVRRLVVVETVHPARLGAFERVARDPSVELVVFDHHAGEAPEWVKPENLVLSEDGALTTTMVGILAEREIEVTPLEATVFALGIHEDTGSLGYPDAGVRDAEALAWCLRHGARQDMVAQYLRPRARRGRPGIGARRGRAPAGRFGRLPRASCGGPRAGGVCAPARGPAPADGR
jgi:tRNA nucleotidyltransferase (CCA-adding enzyme)